MNKRSNWKQLTVKQITILKSKNNCLTEWENNFIDSLRKQGYKVSDKQMVIVNKVLGKIGYNKSSGYSKNFNNQDAPVSQGLYKKVKTIKYTPIEDIGLDYTQSRLSNTNKIEKFYDGDEPPW
jgi:hypothetical protein